MLWSSVMYILFKYIIYGTSRSSLQMFVLLLCHTYSISARWMWVMLDRTMTTNNKTLNLVICHSAPQRLGPLKPISGWFSQHTSLSNADIIIVQYGMSEFLFSYFSFQCVTVHTEYLVHQRGRSHNFHFLFYHCAVVILHSSWNEIKLGTQSSMGIINPLWQRMHDNFKQKLCHSPWGKQRQGWQATLNINMDHRAKDLVTDAIAVLLVLVQKHDGDVDEQMWICIKLEKAQYSVIVTPGTTLRHRANSEQISKISKSLCRQEQQLLLTRLQKI